VHRSSHSGFTLVELIITLVVLAVLAVVSVPSYVELRERQAIRGVADNITVAVGLAKQEAIKRGEMVRVEFHPVGDAVCVGAMVVEAAGDDGCDCSTETCDVVAFPDGPGNTSALRRVMLEGDVVFGDDGDGFVIDPRTGTLEDLGDTGGFVLSTDRGYQIDLSINAMGRVATCTPDGVDNLAGVPVCE
jgi:prepilin-type N-terminal cleavage/methylation domain-containing protein